MNKSKTTLLTENLRKNTKTFIEMKMFFANTSDLVFDHKIVYKLRKSKVFVSDCVHSSSIDRCFLNESIVNSIVRHRHRDHHKCHVNRLKSTSLM